MQFLTVNDSTIFFTRIRSTMLLNTIDLLQMYRKPLKVWLLPLYQWTWKITDMVVVFKLFKGITAEIYTSQLYRNHNYIA